MTDAEADAPSGTAAEAPRAEQPTGRRRVRVIWNPDAGRKAGLPVTRSSREEIEQLLASAGLGDELVEADGPEATQRLAAEAAEAGYDLVVAAGGDGTIGAAAEALIGSATALGTLPLGSVMNVPRSLGMPRDLAAAAEALRTGEIRRIDVGMVNGRPFFEAGSVGINAAVFREAEQVDAGSWGSIIRTIWTGIRYRPARMEIRLDDRVIRTRALMVSVANGPYTGIALTVAPEAQLDDGLFDVVVFRRFSKLQLLRHVASIAFGRRRYVPELHAYRSARVRIASRHPLPCRADSRDLGTTPVEFEVRAAALRVVVPRGAVDAAMTSTPVPAPPGPVGAVGDGGDPAAS